MPFASWIGSIGVALLLAAFFGSLVRVVDARGRVYLTLNFVGAALACWSSYLIPFWPFVILEGTWALVALVGLLRGSRAERGDVPARHDDVVSPR